MSSAGTRGGDESAQVKTMRQPASRHLRGDLRSRNTGQRWGVHPSAGPSSIGGNMRILLALAFAAAFGGSASAQTCNTFGSSTHCNNGLSAQRLGNFTYWSDGSSSQRVGTFTYNSDGSSSQRVGKSTHYSNGTSSQTLGNTTYFSNGRSCQRAGNFVHCD